MPNYSTPRTNNAHQASDGQANRCSRNTSIFKIKAYEMPPTALARLLAHASPKVVWMLHAPGYLASWIVRVLSWMHYPVDSGRMGVDGCEGCGPRSMTVHFHRWEISGRCTEHPRLQRRGRRAMMTSRERMLAAIECEKIDYVPCSFMIFFNLFNRCKTEREFIERQLDFDQGKGCG